MKISKPIGEYSNLLEKEFYKSRVMGVDKKPLQEAIKKSNKRNAAIINDFIADVEWYTNKAATIIDRIDNGLDQSALDHLYDQIDDIDKQLYCSMVYGIISNWDYNILSKIISKAMIKKHKDCGITIIKDVPSDEIELYK